MKKLCSRIKMIPAVLVLILLFLSLFIPTAEADFRNYLFPDCIILAFGDSLTSGTGTSLNKSYPSVLGEILGMKVINGGVPGETISEGLARLSEVVEKHSPCLVLLCEGGNDLLRGREEPEIEKDLRDMVSFLQERGIDVMIIGVPALNLSARVPEFYRKVARDMSVPYEGKILRKILTDPSLKSDYIHPNEKGYRLMAERIAVMIEKNR